MVDALLFELGLKGNDDYDEWNILLVSLWSFTECEKGINKNAYVRKYVFYKKFLNISHIRYNLQKKI